MRWKWSETAPATNTTMGTLQGQQPKGLKAAGGITDTLSRGQKIRTQRVREREGLRGVKKEMTTEIEKNSDHCKG